MARLIKFKIKAKQPCRSFRIIVVGPSGCGRNTVAGYLAKRFGFVNVSISSLLVQQIKNKTPVGATISEYIKGGQLVPDEIIFGLLKSRLEKADCRIHGFVLENFPKTETQIRLLEEMKLDANLIVALDCSKINAHPCKFIDPVSGYKYRQEDFNQLEQCVVDRLESISKKDSREVVDADLEKWASFFMKLKDKFDEKVYTIDAALCVENIIEKIAFTLEQGL